MLHGDDVHITNGVKEKLFQSLVCFLVRSLHSRVLNVNSRGGCDFDGGAGARCVQTWVGQGKKGDD